jgi:hypothetical protein
MVALRKGKIKIRKDVYMLSIYKTVRFTVYSAGFGCWECRLEQVFLKRTSIPDDTQVNRLKTLIRHL